jgi:glycosyltransferase involved in cell wall biosynthesis
MLNKRQKSASVCNSATSKYAIKGIPTHTKVSEFFPAFSGFATSKLKKIGIVIPTFNEEKNIGDVIFRLRDMDYTNILVIDGSSKDNTIKVAEKSGAKIVLQSGRGKGQAIRQALENNYLDTDFLVLLDADGSMDPREIPRYIHALQNGADVAKGSRFLPGGGTIDMSALRKFGNSCMTLSVNAIYSTKYTDICYGFFALNRKAIKALSPLLESNNFEIETELFIKAKQVGLNVVEVPSFENLRKYGESNLNSFRDGTKIFQVIFRNAFA